MAAAARIPTPSSGLPTPPTAGPGFVPDFRVSQGTSNAKDTHSFFDYDDYTQIAFQSHLFYAAWSDNSDSTSTNPDGKLHQVDLYTAQVRIP